MHHQNMFRNHFKGHSGHISFYLTSGGQLPVDGCPTWLWWACPWWTWCPWWLWLWCVLAWWLSGLALCPWPKGDVILFWPGILFACMRAMLDNTVSQPSNPAWWCKRNIKAKAELSKIGKNHTSISFDLVTSSVSTMWALFKSNKRTMSKCFYKKKPRLFWFQLRPKEPKWSSLPWTAHASNGGMEEGVWKSNRETVTRMFLEMKSDSHWPISYGLEQSCWNGVSSSLFECVCVWGKQGGHFTQD